MAYWHDTWSFRNSIEHEFKFAGKYGAKGEKRQKKKKPTPGQIAKQNQRNKETRMRRTIKANFAEKDLWCCCKYPEGIRLQIEDVKKDKSRFLRILRREYEKRGSPLKWVARLEIGERGGIHFHILVNRLWKSQSDILIADAWSRALERSALQSIRPGCRTEGLVDWASTYDSGGYKALADYICKQPEEGTEEYKQLSLFAPEEQKQLLSVTSSRNLIRPEPERHYYSRRTMRKLVEDGPEPTPGYYIDIDSLYIGTNPYTGYSYCKYIELKIPEDRKKTKSGDTFHPPRGGDTEWM